MNAIIATMELENVRHAAAAAAAKRSIMAKIII